MSKKNITIEEKLRLLYDLQIIDSRIDDIRRTRGELPLEIEKIENQINNTSLKLERYKSVLEELNVKIFGKIKSIEESESLIKKYNTQQKNIRNSREYNSIAKEIEYQELEIKLSEKKIQEFKELIEEQKEKTERESEALKDLEIHFKLKKEELSEILLETEKEEEVLLEKSKMFESKIESDLLNQYRRLRENIKNGLAVVPIEGGGTSKGSYFTIPPQIQLEVENRNRVIFDEYSGRILIDDELAKEENEKIEKLLS